MNYITIIANLFLSRSGCASILSPMDYALIAEWEKQGIPLIVVVNALNETFDQKDLLKEPTNIKTMYYFREEVKIRFTHWLMTEGC